jgi:hypothetical protein
MYSFLRQSRRKNPHVSQESRRSYSDSCLSRRYKRGNGQEYRIESVSAAVKLVEELQKKTLPLLQLNARHKEELRMASDMTEKFIWFRGQPDISYDLEPGVFRKQTDKDGNITKFDEHNAIMHLSSIQPSLRELNLFDFLAVAQHQTLPTRLLDWSKNILIGLYFACSEHEDKDGELFALNPSKLNFYSYGRYGVLDSGHIEVLKRAQLAFSRDYKGFLVKRTPFGNLNMRDFEPTKLEKRKKSSYFKKETGLYVGKLLSAPVATHPVLRDHRLVVQQGMFTIHGGKEYFENDYISTKGRLPRPVGLFELQDNVIQRDGDADENIFLSSFLIPKARKSHIMEELEWLGVNRAYIFPEVEYQAKYVRQFWYYKEEAAKPQNDKKNQNKLEKVLSQEAKEFFDAIKNADETTVKNYLLAHKPKTLSTYCLYEMKDECDCSPLYQAAAFGRQNIIDIFMRDMRNRTSLFNKTANPKKHFQAIIDKKTGDDWTALYAAVFYNHAKVAEKLLAYKPDVLIQSEKGDTILHHAARNNSKILVKKLINLGADPLAKNNKGLTPIHYACRDGSIEALEVLIEHHKDLNLMGNTIIGAGRTPLQEACAYGRAGIVDFLLAKSEEYKISIDIDYRNKHSRTAYDIVVSVVNERELSQQLYVKPYIEMKKTLNQHSFIIEKIIYYTLRPSIMLNQ